MFDAGMQMTVEIDKRVLHPLIETFRIGERQRVMSEEDRRRGIARLKRQFFDVLQFFLLGHLRNELNEGLTSVRRPRKLNGRPGPGRGHMSMPTKE